MTAPAEGTGQPQGAGFSQMRRVVERLLSEHFGVHVAVANGAQVPYSHVWRCALTGRGGSVPSTIVLRMLRRGPTRSNPNLLLNEQTALQLLAGLGCTLVPEFYGIDIDAGILVSEDLGNHPSLLDLLLGNDKDAALRGLDGFARSLGTMHAVTIGHADTYNANRALLASQYPHIAQEKPTWALATVWWRTSAAAMRLGLPAPRGAEDDVARIESVLNHADGFQALSSGDPSPVNCAVICDSVRFCDFEEAHFRHALLDARVLRYLYPTGSPVWRLPSDVGAKIERIYRQALAPACPRALDDELFERAMAAACAAWTIERLTRLPKVEAGPDRDTWLLLPPGWSGPIPTRSRRRQLIDTMETCLHSFERAAAFPRLAVWLRQMVEALTLRWPEAEEPVPTYPAFK